MGKEVNTEDDGREGESMSEEKKRGNEEAPEATKKRGNEEGSAEKKEAGKSPGPAPLGGGDQQPNLAAGSKVKTVGDEGDPGLDREDVRRQSGREPAHGEDQEPES